MTDQQKPGVAPGATVMAQVARALQCVVNEGTTAEAALERIAPSDRDRAAVRAVLTGTLRWYLRLAPAVEALLQRGQSMHDNVRAVLTIAIHQIEYSRAVPASVVNIAVDAVKVLGQGSSSGFVNALLRRFMREREAIWLRLDCGDATACAHPRWLLRSLRAAYEDVVADILQANNEKPPMTLRVNTARISVADMAARLQEAGMATKPGIAATSLVLEEPCDIASLPGFAEGLVSVQDAGAQLAAELLDAQPGERVLDACAAPGGKTGHILERTPQLGELWSVDADAARLARVEENLTRLGLTAKTVRADVLADGWWDGVPFDRILLDAPCSGTGVIRRHPDIKLLRRPEDIQAFATTQFALLRRCASMLKPGGRLLYVTCSVLPAENLEVVDRLLAAHPELTRERYDRQLLPAPAFAGLAQQVDGFYYACLKKGEVAG
jgi:16S rRNA (cytosine967-C5)-methyltransferase